MPSGVHNGHLKGAANPMWKGGRVVDPRGYVLIRVGKDHPLADVRGYAYEHRLLAEKKLKRALRSGEIVHHRDDTKGNNARKNLDIKASQAEHLFEHRKPENRFRLRMPGAPNPTINCGCGCGAEFLQFDQSNRPRRFVPGHNLRLPRERKAHDDRKHDARD